MKTLILPKLNQTPWDENSILRSDSQVEIPVSDDFQRVWDHGPKSSSDQDLLEALVILGKTFCELIRFGQGKTTVTEKNGPTDLVTEMDSGIEMLFRMWLAKFFPDHKIIGEEGTKADILPGDTVWYLDPIDGTSNYVVGSLQVGINLGCMKEGRAYLAFVAAPFLQAYYYGIEGGPVYRETLQSGRIELAPHFSIKTIIASEFREKDTKTKAQLQAVLGALHGTLLRTKCTAIDLLNLLEGNITGFFQMHVKMWDIVAPLILVKLLFGDQFRYDIFLKDLQNPIDLFSQHPDLLTCLNHPDNSQKQVGLCIVYPRIQQDYSVFLSQLDPTLFNPHPPAPSPQAEKGR